MACSECGGACQGGLCRDCKREMAQEERYGTPAENVEYRREYDPIGECDDDE